MNENYRLMNTRAKRTLTRWAVAASLCIIVALCLIVLLGIWGVYRDLRLVRQTLLQAELRRIESHAVRTLARIEHQFQSSEGAVDLAALCKEPWIEQHWQEIAQDSSRRRFAAIVDPAGKIILHSDPALSGGSLGRQWYDHILRDSGDAFETRSTVLSGGRRAYDVRLPIMVHGHEVGEYHVGLIASSLKARLHDKDREILGHWIWLLGGIAVVVAMAAMSLYYVLTRWAADRRALVAADLERVAEVGRLAAGLAHEIRNPLHALRMNLHALSRVCDGKAELSSEDAAALMRESNQEIERLNRLMQELLGFAKPDEACEEDIDVAAHLRATLNLVDGEMEQNQIDVHTELPDHPVYVRMDPSRFRQVMLNLLLNAKEALPEGGRVDVQLEGRPRVVEILVSDDGPGIPTSDLEEIFEAFYSTKQDGSGLGLSLVKRFVEDAGGNVGCEGNGARATGTTFRVRLPRTKRKRQ